ncbi:hypothetical protein [Draconibacterium orientale]|uniref:hypothetical protein n=1 Tax=Draconibacterium orientale TaxID=1168034 RepID=UPI0029C032EA|nr:hypothetical protein [Draconibacterium orientale]
MAITINKTPEQVNLTGNPIFYELASSLAHPTIYIHCQLQVYYGGAWINATTDEDKIEADANGGVTVQVQALLNKYLVQKFTFPESTAAMFITQSGMSIQFRIKHKESWIEANGTEGESASYTEDSNTYYAIKGGVPNELLAIFNTAQTDWWNELKLNKQFCTWQPREKRTYPGAVEKLYWIFRATATLTLSIAWTATDATTGTIAKTNTANAYSVGECCISPALVEELAGKEIASYVVSIDGQSEERTYTIDRTYYDRADNFAFDNSMGCYDCLTAVGWRTEKGSNERSSYNKRFPLYPELTDRTRQNSRAWRTDKNESNTGFLIDTDWLEYMRELDLSRDAYKLEGSLARPVNIDTDEGITIDDSNDLLSYPITWSFAHKNRYWGKTSIVIRTPIPPYPESAIAMFDRRVGNKLIDRISGAEATIDATGVTFPELAADVFDKSDTTYWDASIPNTGGNNRKWLFSELNWEFMVDYATDAAHGTLFLKDFESDVRSTLPIMVYNPALNEAGQTEIVNYLNTYLFIVDSTGAVIQDSDNAFVVDVNS